MDSTRSVTQAQPDTSQPDFNEFGYYDFFQKSLNSRMKKEVMEMRIPEIGRIWMHLGNEMQMDGTMRPKFDVYLLGPEITCEKLKLVGHVYWVNENEYKRHEVLFRERLGVLSTMRRNENGEFCMTVPENCVQFLMQKLLKHLREVFKISGNQVVAYLMSAALLGWFNFGNIPIEHVAIDSLEFGSNKLDNLLALHSEIKLVSVMGNITDIPPKLYQVPNVLLYKSGNMAGRFLEKFTGNHAWLRESTVTEEELNTIVKRWIEGKNTELQTLVISYTQPRTYTRAAISGIQFAEKYGMRIPSHYEDDSILGHSITCDIPYRVYRTSTASFVARKHRNLSKRYASVKYGLWYFALLVWPRDFNSDFRG